MIDFEHVYKTYETHNDENVALEDINIHIDEGEFVFILGHSGAGKSTFLKLIQMEEKPTEGKVFINGQDLTRIKRRKVPYLRRQMGVVFQDFRLIPTMTVYENVAFAMRVTNISTKKIKDRVPFALSLVGLEDKMDRLPDELSGGEQQRVAVARALAHGPKLIIADEPTGNIDPEMSMDIMQLFEAINKVNITVVVVTHEHELVHKLARKYGNRVITLANGMVASDTADPAAARRYAAAMAEREEDEIRVIQSYLPRQLDEAEAAAAIDKAIADLGAESIRDMGRVMAELRTHYAGQMDFGAVGPAIKERLMK